jgi:NADH-quinone oxidoreductase subunit F
MRSADGAVGRSPLVRVAATPGHGETVLTAVRDAADVPVVATGPTGIEAWEPLVLATRNGRTAFLADPEPSTARAAVETLADGDLPTDPADAVVDHDPDAASLPVPDDGPLAVGRRAALAPCGWVDPVAPDDLSFVTGAADPAAVGGLLGRGRGDAVADDSVVDVWETVREADGDPVVVVNANEANDEPRADRTLLAGAPLAVLDGAAAVAEHVGATDVIVYLNESDRALGRRVRAAVDAAADAFPVDPQVVAGPDSHRAGAPTAALEALEGADRIEPRLQPPTPAEHGLYGRPTAVHTPRTVAQVRCALRSSGFDPEAADPGTRLVTVTGDVAAPATVELPPTARLDAACDAVAVDGAFKTACVGGVLGGFTRDLDIAPTAAPLRAAGLGTDGVLELLNEERCVVATAGERARFAAEANSGRCVPGREGTTQLVELLREVYDGRVPTDEIDELGRVMARSSNCQTGAHAPRPVRTALAAFEPEFRAHADGRCVAGTCGDSP